MSDHRDELLAHLRDALRRRYWLQRKMDDTGPSLYDTSRAVWADEEISDLSGISKVTASRDCSPNSKPMA